jgi:2-polyprenyl-3-methyl-5-hydroxy-6-metoxy-1,4-benzoquinol methylase
MTERSPSPLEVPAALQRRFEVARTEVTIAGRTYDLLRPRNIDDLISEEDFDIDERIPYWAECWPSGRVLAERVLGQAGEGRTMLELGCGIGVVCLAAAQAGFRVLGTDYYAEALEFTEANAQRHGIAGIDTRLVDWRRLPDDLGTFDLVTAADVLYETPQVALVATTIARTLAPQGVAWLADPGRRTAVTLVEECAKQGLAAECIDQVRSVDANAQLTVSVFEIRHQAVSA